MKQSLTKIVDVILNMIQDSRESAPSESGIRTWLAGQGYNKRDIDAAMKLVVRRIAEQPCVEQWHPTPVRQLSESELFKLSPEARDAMIRLDMYGLIDPGEREAMFDRLYQFDGEVGLEELDYLLSWIVSGRDIESQHTIYNVFENLGDTLH